MILSRFEPLRLAFLAVGCAGLATILAALVFEHGFGYTPCQLCLQQRWPYYLGVPLALLAGAPIWLPASLRIIAGVALLGLFAWGLYLGIYQAGAEWRYWLGPRDCSSGASPLDPSVSGNLLDAIQNSKVASCTDPQFRFLGLSFAGWNAVVMSGLISTILAGFWRQLRSR